MQIKENYSLKELTTMKVGGPAKYFAEASTIDELKQAVDFARDKEVEIFMLGGGSNIIVSDSGFDGMVIRFLNTGREIVSEDDISVTIKVAAGEVLDDIVAWTVEQGWCGIENLSYVPGYAAGLAIQSVNAYGHDAGNVIESVEVLELATGDMQTMTNEECRFGYRRSRFNQEDKGRYVVLTITLKLSKKCMPVLKYPDVVKWFEDRDHSDVKLSEIREAITEIRKRKGMDPHNIKSTGSTFKNLLLTQEEFDILHTNVQKNYGEEKAQALVELKDRFARVEDLYKSQTGVSEIDRDARIKIPTAFLFDKIMNLKGTSVGDAQISHKQAIAIINTGNATADDVMQLFKKIRQLVHKQTGMIVTNEPELIGFSQKELDNYFGLQ